MRRCASGHANALTRAPIFFAPPWDAPTSTVPGGLGRGSSGRLDRRGGRGGRGARPVHAREPFSSLRADSGAARRYTCISHKAAALARRIALHVNIVVAFRAFRRKRCNRPLRLAPRRPAARALSFHGHLQRRRSGAISVRGLSPAVHPDEPPCRMRMAKAMRDIR